MCDKKGEIFKIVVHRDIQNQSYHDFQGKISRIDGREHFFTRFLRLYNVDKKLDLAVDLGKLDETGTVSIRNFKIKTNYKLVFQFSISEFYFWQSVISEVKRNGRKGVGSGLVGYIRLDINQSNDKRPNDLVMSFPLQVCSCQ